MLREHPNAGFRLFLVSSALLGALAGCRGDDAAPPEVPATPEAPAAEGSAEAPSTAAPTADADACTAAAARLRGPTEPAVGAELDVAERTEFVRTVDAPGLIAALPSLGDAGLNARGLVEALDGRMEGDDLALAEAIWQTLPRISVEDTLEIAARRMMDGDSLLAERRMAAATLGRLGVPGLERLASLHGMGDSSTDDDVIMGGIAAARNYPLALRETVFATEGLCAREANEEVCLSLLGDLSLVWPQMTIRQDAPARLLTGEREALMTGGPTPLWYETFSVALAQFPGPALVSLERVQQLGPNARALDASLRALTHSATATADRREQVLWLLSNGPALDVKVDAIDAALQNAGGAAIAGLIGTVAVAAGITDISDAAAERIAEVAVNSRTAVGWAAHLAAVRVLGVDRFAEIDATALPDGFAALRDAVAGDDIDALVGALLDESLSEAIAVDGAVIGAAGRRAAFTRALMDDAVVASPRVLEIAARGAEPNPDLAAKLVDQIDASTMAPSIAWWLTAASQARAVREAAQRALASDNAATRRRAVQWAAIARGDLDREALVNAVTAPPSGTLMEPPNARLLPLYRLLADEPLPLSRALELEVDGAGEFETTMLLAASYARECGTTSGE